MRARRLLIPAAMAAAGLVLGSSPASAAQVTVLHGTFTEDPPAGVAPAGTICPFEVTIDELITGTYSVVFDKDGNFIRGEVHITYDAEATANGITLHDSSHWTDIDYADSTHMKVGVHAHVTGPDGQVLLNAGLVITFGSHDNVVEYHGLQSELEGASICSAFTT